MVGHTTSILVTLIGAAVTSPLDEQFTADQTPPQSQQDDFPTVAACDCSGTRPALGDNSAYICGDSRLGPIQLPSKFPLLSVVSSYDRLAGSQPAEYLAEWTNATGFWNYPPSDGFLLSSAGEPILANTTLIVGTRLDRFGSPTGKYLGAADAPFNQRALPPDSLNVNPMFPDRPFNYHIYEVAKPFEVVVGPIAPWFGQPGLGSQFWTGPIRNIQYLLDEGYLIEDMESPSPDPVNARAPCG